MRRVVVVPAVLVGGVAVLVAAAVFLVPWVQRAQLNLQQAELAARGYAAPLLPAGALDGTRAEVRPGGHWMVLFRGLGLPCDEVSSCTNRELRPGAPVAPVVQEVAVCLTPPAASGASGTVVGWRFQGIFTLVRPAGPSTLCDYLVATSAANPANQVALPGS